MELPYEVANCPACGLSDDEEIASQEEISREVEQLWEFHIRRLRPGTPRRFLTDRIVFSQDPPLRIGRCRGCRTIFRNPRERSRDLLELYAEEEIDTGTLQGLFESQRATYRIQARRLSDRAGPTGVAMEIGSYVGAFQAAAREVGWEVDGVDVNPGAAAFARDAGFRVQQGQISDTPDTPRFDAVTIWNCFDQLPDPRGAVRAARRRLRDAGILAIRVPSGEFYARMRARSTGRGSSLSRAALAHNNLLGFPYRTGYTASSLSALLRSEGFGSIDVVGDTLVPISDRWTRPWGRWEERAVKAVLRAIAPGPRAPWLEIYARAGTAEAGRA